MSNNYELPSAGASTFTQYPHKLLELSRLPHVYSERYKDLLNIVKLHTDMFHDFHNIKREEPLLVHDVFTKV